MAKYGEPPEKKKREKSVPEEEQKDLLQSKLPKHTKAAMVPQEIVDRKPHDISPHSSPPVPQEREDEQLKEVNLLTLERNLNQCLQLVDNSLMKAYVPVLQRLDVWELEEEDLKKLESVQFFKITELVYQEDEFTVHKLATVFHALSNKPCTLILMLQSDGSTTNLYLGVRSRDPEYDTGTMRKILGMSLEGQFPGSKTEEYLTETMEAQLKQVSTASISCVTCVADYKQDRKDVNNEGFIQGLEKFIYSMQGRPCTAFFIANNLSHDELREIRREYEEIYTQLSPFATMQYNFGENQSKATSDSESDGTNKTKTTGSSTGKTEQTSVTETESTGGQESTTETDTEGVSDSTAEGHTTTTGKTEGSNESTTETNTIGMSRTKGKSFGVSLILSANKNKSKTFSASNSIGSTHGTSRTESVSSAISKTLTHGINHAHSTGTTKGTNWSSAQAATTGTGTQYSESESISDGISFVRTRALTDTFGTSQGITLNMQNKSLVNILQRLEVQMNRLDECESIGMWNFAAYFLGESEADTGTAASMYQSLISGNQSGVELSAVNTWTDQRALQVGRYVTNFLHPIFLYEDKAKEQAYRLVVDPTALSSTNELAIQMGLPRSSVKGLPVIEHAAFAQEVLQQYQAADKPSIPLGKIFHLGRKTDTDVLLDRDALTAHAFVTGSTGAGKSNTIYTMLNQLCFRRRDRAHFLVIEPAKGEYKAVFGGRHDVSVYGTNPKKTDLLALNPFAFPDDIHILEHIDRLTEVFNACWPMYAAMPAVLKDGIERAYRERGWDLVESVCRPEKRFPTFDDLLNVLPAVMRESDYSAETKGDYTGALVTRVRSLRNGINGQVFCSATPLSDEALFDRNVIVDLSRVGSAETKALLMGILIIKLQEYRMAKAENSNSELRHITVLEEAHNLLRRTSFEQAQEGSNLQGKSVEMLSNAIAEMRTYGEGFIIADQAPGLLDLSTIRNTNTKIIMRLPDESDRMLVGKAAGLTDEQVEELSRLDVGVAAVFQNHWLEPVLCKVDRLNEEEQESYTGPARRIRFRTPQEKLLERIVYPMRDGLLLKDAEIAELKEWIARLNTPSSVRESLLNQMKGDNPLDIERKKHIFYTLLNGKSRFKGVLEGETPELVAVRVDMHIVDSLGVSHAIAEEIRKLAFQYAAERVDILDYRDGLLCKRRLK